MKAMYKEKEIANNIYSYTSEAIMKPYLNGVELDGSLSLDDVSVYDKETVEDKITDSRSVLIVTTLPVPTIPNTLYYVGPKADGSYDRFLFDATNSMTNLGPISPTLLNVGNGVDATNRGVLSARCGVGVTTIDETRKIELKIAETINPNNDTDLASPLAVYNDIFTGCTENVSGTRGLVPDLQILSDENSRFALNSSGNWREYQMCYVSSTAPTGDLQIGDLWVKPWN